MVIRKDRNGSRWLKKEWGKERKNWSQKGSEKRRSGRRQWKKGVEERSGGKEWKKGVEERSGNLEWKREL